MQEVKTMHAYATMRAFLDLADADAGRLAGFLPRIEARLPEITDRFYAMLGRQEELQPLLEGRLEALKRTHVAWLRGLFCGRYDDGYFAEQLRVGLAHVRVNLDSMWVDAVMSTLRRELHAAVLEASGSQEEATEVYGSLLKVIDLSLMTINMAYNENRMNVLHDVTGMPKALIERLIRVGVSS
jgi:hypothetical protein